MLGRLRHANVSIKPSKVLKEFLESIEITNDGLHQINSSFKERVIQTEYAYDSMETLLNAEDLKQLEELIGGNFKFDDTDLKFDNTDLKFTNSDFKCNNTNVRNESEFEENMVHNHNETISLRDVIYIYEMCKAHHSKPLHELLESCDVILPSNEVIVANGELEERREKLKIEQENKIYKGMTKNVDSLRKSLPDGTVACQLREIHRNMIAIVQFVVSILAGFAFGFIGLEYIVGDLDVGLRILLGVFVALVVAVAELYFLGKRLNGDVESEEDAKMFNVKSNMN